MEEKLLEIMCDVKDNYFIENDEHPKVRAIKEIIEIIRSYNQPVKVKIKSGQKTSKYALEIIAEMHNEIIYAKKELEDYNSKIKELGTILENAKNKK